MNFFSGIVLVILSVMLVGTIAPMVGDHYRAKEAQEHAVQFEAAKHERAVKACAEGKTNSYIYNGVRCKGFN